MKYRIKDGCGNAYEVEEVIDSEEVKTEDEDENEAEEKLTKDDISSLKRLASVADHLVTLVKDAKPEKEEVEDEEEENEEKVVDSEEIEDEDEEEVKDTKKKAKDSKESFGQIENHKTHLDDSYDAQLEIASAWSKRYGG